MILIDTDHATYLKYPESERGRRLVARLTTSESSELFGVAIVTIEERMVNAQLALGLTRNLMGKTREAEQPLQKAVQLDPKNPDAHFELAKNQFALQKFADAEAAR